MKHTIKITVDEFLENGGILVEGRDLFGENGKIIGEYYFLNDEDIHIYRNNIMSAPLLEEFVYIEIDVIPIYK
jgi:hypothetical protein